MYYSSVNELGNKVATLIQDACSNWCEGNSAYRRYGRIKARYAYDPNTNGGCATLAVEIEATSSSPHPPYLRFVIISLKHTNSVLKKLGFRPNDKSSELQSVDYPEFGLFGNVETLAPRDRESMAAASWKELTEIRTQAAQRDEIYKFDNMMVYCDLLDYSLAGDSLVQLLAMATIKSNAGEVADALEAATRPVYVKVASRKFKRIRIWISDQYGEPVLFDAAKSIVSIMLNFRNRQ
jgi:hypothetical protein